MGDELSEDSLFLTPKTSGTYYFVSSLDMVSLRAKKVARHLMGSISTTRNSRSLKNPNVYERTYVS